ncbi:MAG: SDR family NAD(P)-dependent oxidoreductase [Acidimicrobiia bacterium]
MGAFDDHMVRDSDGQKWGIRVAHRLSTVRADFSLAVIEAGLIAVAYSAALGIRSLDPTETVPTTWWSRLAVALPLIMLVHLGANVIFGNYGHVWRYASIEEAVRVVAAAMSAGVVMIALAGLYQRFISPSTLVPLSVLVMGTFLSLAGMGGLRFWSRLFSKQRMNDLDRDRQRALVVGVGADAVRVARHRSDSTANLHIVGFVDTSSHPDMSRVLAGFPVLGGVEDVPALVSKLDIHQVVIASNDADEIGRRLVDLCIDVEVRLRILPAIDTVLDGHAASRDIRDLELTDLLPRTPVSTDLSEVADFLKNRIVMVTGGGGSIGSEIVQQALGFDCAQVIAVDNDETHLHDAAARWKGAGDRVVTELADIRDRRRVAAIFDRYQPDVVFHAAAHKHVPILEKCPEEAIKTNVDGTLNVIDEADRCEATRSFVLISTDKAVEPESVMGSSKRVAEMLVQSRAEAATDMQWSAVRFGNVLGSRGSVVPTFKRQVQEGGPVTVSHPDIERYFMTVAEAVELVLQAASISDGGEVFVLDMGSPVRILDLAHRMIRLAGLVPYVDIDVVITGLRPGERLSEQLADVPLVPSRHPQILIARQGVPGREHLNDTIGVIRALADQGHPKLGELLVAIANDLWRENDLSILEWGDVTSLHPVEQR